MKKFCLLTFVLFAVGGASAVAQDVRYNLDKDADFLNTRLISG